MLVVLLVPQFREEFFSIFILLLWNKGGDCFLCWSLLLLQWFCSFISLFILVTLKSQGFLMVNKFKLGSRVGGFPIYQHRQVIIFILILWLQTLVCAYLGFGPIWFESSVPFYWCFSITFNCIMFGLLLVLDYQVVESRILIHFCLCLMMLIHFNTIMINRTLNHEFDNYMSFCH